ncbi:PKD domain-containing protein, partial [Winogradskyella sp.]|uniref:PKD domain-containing protein n=1 Tax=Winogradskyella sp. TaxID=1883156 RepID=UPI003F6AFEDE
MKKILLLLTLFTAGLGFSQDIIMSNGTFNQCSDVFYDSGGEFGPYSLDENLVTTICPDVAGDFIQLDFTEFFTQQGLNVDTMNIYDGDDVTATLLGSYFGPVGAFSVNASDTNTSGCLTIEFISGGSGIADGWAADIVCFTPCQTITPSIDNTTPAAVAGTIEVDPGEIINFEGSSTFSVDGTGATYTWDFGNGDTLNGQNVNYAYPNPGTYTVTLIVTDTNPLGCTETDNSIQVDVLDNDTCAGALPICSDISNVPSPVGIGDAEGGIDYDCLGSQPNPRWYFLQTGDTPGDLFFTLTQSSTPNGPADNDVDFIIWGPFSQPECGADDLNATTQEDCSYSASATEDITILGAPANSFYVLLITNFSGDAGFINLELDTVNSTATTNCDIICQVNLGADQDLCDGDSYLIDPTFNGAFNTFEWQLDGVTIPGETGPTLNATQSGTYTLLADGFDAVFGDPCSTQDEIVIGIADPFVLNNISLTECSAAVTAEFDLDAEIANILNPLDVMDYTVTFHPTLNDAENGTAALTGTNAYNGTNGEIVYVRTEANGTSCFATSTITLNFSAQPIINPVANIEICDDDSNDGFEEFDLSAQTAGILGAQPATDYEVTYHLSFADADGDTGALSLNYVNTVADSQPIFVRIESVTDAACYNASAVEEFRLIVNDRAIANQPMDMVVCDDSSNDGFETFDLGSQIPDILGGQDPATFNVSFHSTQADADNNSMPLATNYTNTIPNLEPVFVRVEDPANPDCFGTITFDLIVNPVPDIVPVSPLQVCDDDTDGFMMFNLTTKIAEILNGQTGVTVTFHETLADATAGTPEITDGYINTTANNQTIFIRLENSTTTCFNLNVLNLEVIANPTANATTPLEVCDDDNDGFAEFDLSTKDAEVIGAQAGVIVSYYDTPAEADAGTNSLPINYTNIVAGSQQIFVRIEDGTTGCYDITTLQLIVNPRPTVVAVTPYELCDANNPGDEQELFDLPTKDAEILDGQVNVTVSYYENQADADAGINAITTLYGNTSNPQPVVAVLTNTLTGCTSSVSFDLVVNPLPAVVAPTPLEVCDDGVPDGFTEIDLSIKNTEITGNNPNYSVSYYATQADADAEVNPLPTLYTNTTNPQTIFVRVEDINTGCYDTTTLDVVVEQAPVANTPNPLRYCDPDNDGFGLFTLTDVDNEITGGAPGLTVSYHETFANADNNVDAIDTTVTYNNIVINTQTLYVRVESSTIATACATVVELQLIVEPTPQLIEPTPLEECDDISADGFATFDLTTKASEVLNGQDPMQYMVSYHETEANANAGTNPIANPNAYTNTTANTQIIWIRVADTMTVAGCYKLTTLELIVNPLPVLVQPAPLELCDAVTPDDEQEGF